MENNSGKLASQLGESLYQNAVIGDNDSIDGNLECSQYGDNPQHEADEELQKHLHEAATEYMLEQTWEISSQFFEGRIVRRS